MFSVLSHAFSVYFHIMNFIFMKTEDRSDWVLLVNTAEQGADRVVFRANSLSPHELAEVRREQLSRGAEVALQLALGPHPHVFHVVGVDRSVVRINKVVVVDDDIVLVYATVDVPDLRVCGPAVRDDA